MADHSFRAKKITQQVFTMYSHQRWLRSELAHRQCEMMPTVEPAAKNMQREGTEFRSERLRDHELDQLIAARPVFDQRCDRDHFQPELCLELDQLRQPLHCAVIVNKFTQHTRG